MIKKLRKRFILISFGIVAAVILAVVVGIDLANYLDMKSDADEILSLLEKDASFDPFFSGGAPSEERNAPSPFDKKGVPGEARFSARYFIVRTDGNGTVTHTDFSRIATVEESELSTYLSKAKKKQGFVGNFRYKKEKTADGFTYVFLDCEKEIVSTRTFIISSAIFTFAGLIVIAGLILLLSKKALAPVEESYEKQKRFITDASHELKTPLTVISANAELLELETGENEWIDSIKNQVQKLSKLTKELVFLSRMDEGSASFEKESFSLKTALEEVAEGFEEAALVKGKKIEIASSDVSVCANEEMIRRVIGLILDNAIKYAESETISVSLRKEGNRAVLKQSNAASLSKGEHPELFERFYRPDASRTSATGGHGIGLSVVRSVAEAHGGSASAVSDGEKITFEIKLPL